MFGRVAALFALGTFFGFAAIPAAAGSPSFDCDGVRFSVEKLICQDDELSELDIEVARAYAAALSRAPASRVGMMKSAQTAWRREMLRCERSDDQRACTMAAYESRLKQF